MIISQAMLKLTHSFCRYLKLTCDHINFNTTHVKRYSHLNCGRNICVTLYAQNSIADTFTHTCEQLRLFASIKKRLRLKRPQKCLSEDRKTSQMSNPLLPSVAYISHGDDTPDEDENAMGCDGAFPSTSSHRPNNKRRDKIPPNFRKWERVAKEAPGKPFRFRVVSYNVLAQYLLECHPYLYTECDPEDLAWKVRSERLFTEIMALDPDILCLQEVQSTHIKSFYVRFEERGYYGIYKKKTGHREDGCAIYFKKDMFDLVDHMSVEYYQPGMPILNRDNVGLMMKLMPRKSPTTPIVVATTHLLYNPKRNDVRLAQLQVLLAELDRFAYFTDDYLDLTGYHPIVLTGDFNSIPESSVVKLLDKGKVKGVVRDSSDWRNIAVTDGCQHLTVVLNRPCGFTIHFSMVKIFNSEMVTSDDEDGSVETTHYETEDEYEAQLNSGMFNKNVLRHPLRLTSVYPRTKPDHNEEATTFQDNWVTVDYMYFSCCNKLRLLERLRLPTKQECQVLGSLPNDVYGSDHLVLAAYFEIRQHTAAF